MKNVFLSLVTALAAGVLPLSGAEYIWTGLGNPGDWNDPENWNRKSGTPGSGDVVYMNRTVRVDGATHNVELPIVITSPVVLGEGGLTLKIGTSVTNYISGAISGPGQLRITGNNLAIGRLTAIQSGNNAWTSALVLSGANTYEGGTSVYNVFLRGDSVSAFGADGTSVEFGGDASVSLNAPGKWRGYTYRIGSPTRASRPLSLQFGESLEWNGSLVRDDEGTGNKLYLLARQGGDGRCIRKRRCAGVESLSGVSFDRKGRFPQRRARQGVLFGWRQRRDLWRSERSLRPGRDV